MNLTSDESEIRFPRLLRAALLALALAIAGCGGGGGGNDNADSSNAGDTAGANDSDGTQSSNATTTLTAADLAGSYASDCVENSEVSVPAGQVRQIVTLTLSQSAGDRLAFNRLEEYFDPADVSCTGNSIGDYQNGSSENSWQIDGGKDASFDSSIVSATAITVTTGISTNFSAGTIIVLKGITFPGDYFVRSGETKDLAYIDSTGALHLGSGAAGSDGYPDAVDDGSGLKKQ